jgi:hypothetical protein
MRETTMANFLFSNVRIFDGSGAAPYVGEVLVHGNRIARIGRGARALPRSSKSVKQCVKHGIEIVYHASFADEEALDMLEANPGACGSYGFSLRARVGRLGGAAIEQPSC